MERFELCFSTSHNMKGVAYYEGTCIWKNNLQPIKTILPHGVPVGIHNIFQKRINSKK